MIFGIYSYNACKSFVGFFIFYKQQGRIQTNALLSSEEREIISTDSTSFMFSRSIKDLRKSNFPTKLYILLIKFR